MKLYFRIYCLFIFACVCSSCYYILPTKSSPHGYQKYDSYILEDGKKVQKLNLEVLDRLLQNHPKVKYFILAHNYQMCTSYWKEYKHIRELVIREAGDSVYFVPIIFDNLYRMQPKIRDSNSYNSDQIAFVLDKSYGKSFNPIWAYYEKFQTQFFERDTLGHNRNYMVPYQGRYLIFSNSSCKNLHAFIDSSHICPMKITN